MESEENPHLLGLSPRPTLTMKPRYEDAFLLLSVQSGKRSISYMNQRVPYQGNMHPHRICISSFEF